jgi:hypothetical protein
MRGQGSNGSDGSRDRGLKMMEFPSGGLHVLVEEKVKVKLINRLGGSNSLILYWNQHSESPKTTENGCSRIAKAACNSPMIKDTRSNTQDTPCCLQLSNSKPEYARPAGEAHHRRRAVLRRTGQPSILLVAAQ